MKRSTFLIAALAVTLIVAACGGSGTGSDVTTGRGGTATEVGSPVVDGTPLAPVPAAGSDPALGVAVPQVSSVNFAGDPTELLVEGRPAVVLVAAHWCPHCQADVEALRKFFADGGEFNAGVDFVVLHTWPAAERGNWPASTWLDGLGDRIVLDDAAGTAATSLGLTGTPMWVAVTADGTVERRVVGEVAPSDVAAWAEELAS